MPYREATPEQKTAWDELTRRPWKPLADGGPEILLRQVSPNTWQLLEGFRYEVPAHAREADEPVEYAVPPHHLHRGPRPGNSTDLASVPPLLWWFIASHGKHTRAALLHDHLIDLDCVPDKRADRIFRVALEESQVHFVRRWLMWTAVSLATLKRRRFGAALATLFGLHLIALLASALWWAVWRGQPLLPITLAALGLAWGIRRWPLSVLGASLIALPSAVIGLSYLSNYCVDWLVYALDRTDQSGNPRPRPELGQPYRHESGPF